MAVPQASAGVPPRGTAWSVPADTAAIQFPTITAPGVPVFFWPPDFSGALRVTYGDRRSAAIR